MFTPSNPGYCAALCGHVMSNLKVDFEYPEKFFKVEAFSAYFFNFWLLYGMYYVRMESNVSGELLWFSSYLNLCIFYITNSMVCSKFVNLLPP
jgi:hypothetical protein